VQREPSSHVAEWPSGGIMGLGAAFADRRAAVVDLPPVAGFTKKFRSIWTPTLIGEGRGTA